jgi:hypothetical protein
MPPTAEEVVDKAMPWLNPGEKAPQKNTQPFVRLGFFQ